MTQFFILADASSDCKSQFYNKMVNLNKQTKIKTKKWILAKNVFFDRSGSKNPLRSSNKLNYAIFTPQKHYCKTSLKLTLIVNFEVDLAPEAS